MEAKKTIKIRRLGRTGLKVSEICLGAMTLSNFATEEEIAKRPGGNMPIATKEVSLQIIEGYVAAGGNFIDTANVYVDGDSEQFLGDWMASKSTTNPRFRDSMIIATKCYFSFGKDSVNDRGLSRRSIIASVEGSLKRLQTSYIDILQCHCYDRSVPLEETLCVLNDLVTQGKIRYIGISNWTASQLQRAVDICKAKNYAPIAVAQMQYSLVCREIEWEFIELCIREGVGVIAWSPLAGGLLTGRYTKDEEVPPGTRISWMKDRGVKFGNIDNKWDVVSKLKDIADKHKVTPSQVAIRWVLEKEGLVGPIIGARTLKQFEDNISAALLVLSSEDVKILDDVSASPAPYPWNFQSMLGGIVDVGIGMKPQIAS